MEYFLKYEPGAIIYNKFHSVCPLDIPAGPDPDNTELKFFYDNIQCDDIEVVISATMNKLYPEGGLMLVCDGSFLCRPDMPSMNCIASSIAGQTILGNVLIGCCGDRNGEPDIVGFESYEEAEAVANTIRRWLIDNDPNGWVYGPSSTSY